MPPLIPPGLGFGTGGGSGRGLGPAPNIFGDNTTANRAAAEALRDVQAMDAVWLALYANRALLIQLVWMADDVVQRRNQADDDWEDVTDIIIGARGPGPTNAEVTAAVQAGVKPYARLGSVEQVPDTDIPDEIMRDAELTIAVILTLIGLSQQELDDLFLGVRLVNRVVLFEQADGTTATFTLPPGGATDGVLQSVAFNTAGDEIDFTLDDGTVITAPVPDLLRQSGVSQTIFDALEGRVETLEGYHAQPGDHPRYFGWSVDRDIETADFAAANTSQTDTGTWPATAINAYPWVAVPEDQGAPTQLFRGANPINQIQFFDRRPAGTVDDVMNDAYIVIVSQSQLTASVDERPVRIGHG